MEKKLDSNYTRMMWAILNKSWRKFPTKQQLYGHLPPITKTIQVRWTRHMGHCWRSRDKFISDILLWTHSYGWAKAGQPTYNSSVTIQDVALKTYWKRWAIERSAGIGSGRSLQVARHDVIAYHTTEKEIFYRTSIVNAKKIWGLSRKQ